MRFRPTPRQRLFFAAILLASPLGAQEQIVMVEAVPPDTPPGSEIELTAFYSTASPEDETLTGLGLRLHWDSSELDFVAVEELESVDLRAQGPPEPDFADFDGDDDTDTFVHLAWADLEGEWPGPGTTPTALCKLVFQTSSVFSGSTRVEISASSTAAGWVLSAEESLFDDGFETGGVTAWTGFTGFQTPAPAKLDGGLSEGFALTELLIARAGELPTLTELDFPLLDVDGDGTLDVLTDGLLALRYLFGFTGDALIDGAAAAGATRTTAAEISAFLSEISTALDVDLDGRRDALTDGLLVMRFLAGFTGEALTDGALAAAATRTDPEQIAEFLGVLADPAGQGDLDGDGVADIDEVVGLEILLDLDGLGPGGLTTRLVTSDPLRVDTDEDGLDDFEERALRTDPRASDTDFDTLGDLTELQRYASAPASVDSDGDSRGPDGTGIPNPLFFDGNELALFGTSPTLADTDGDARTDFTEANQNGTPPLVANVPRLAVELVGEVNVDLEYTSTETSETRMLESTLVAQTDTSGQSSTDSASSRWSIGASATVTAGVEAGVPGGVSASAEASVSVSGDYGEENSTSFTEDSSTAIQNQFQQSQETARQESQQITGGVLRTGLRIRNLGDVTFTLSNLGITALLRNPDDRRQFRAVATLVPALGGGITLGPFNGTTGVLEVADPEVETGLATGLLADPAGLFLDVASFDLIDAEGRNFAFLAEVTNARTALLTIDFGDGEVQRYRVATLVERNPDGTSAGITFGEVLTDVLEIPFETLPRMGSTDPEFPNGVEVLTQVAGVQTDIDGDPAAFRNSFWAVLSDDPEITGETGVPFTTDFEDIRLFSGDTVSLVYVVDDDRDRLFRREEFLYGTLDEPRDFDGDGEIDAAEAARTDDFDEDGLSDFAEVRTGWMVDVDGQVAQLVHPDPTRPDTDRFDTDGDGLSDGDGLTDLEEFRGRDGCGPHDPADPGSPDPACPAGQTDSGDATDPTTPDSDSDGLSDAAGIDDDPLDPFNVPPVIDLQTPFNPLSGSLILIGSVTDVTDPIDSVLIDWGDGASTCLASDCPPPCPDPPDPDNPCQEPESPCQVPDSQCEVQTDFEQIDLAHQYLTAGSYPVAVVATDVRPPPGSPATAEADFGPFEVAFPGDEEARYFFTGGSLADLTGNGHDGTLMGSSNLAHLTPDRFGNVDGAYCLENNGSSGLCTGFELDHFLIGPQLTVAAWILPDQLDGMIFGQWLASEDVYVRLFFKEPGRVAFEIDDGMEQALVEDPTSPPRQDANDDGQCAASSERADWTFYAATAAYDGADTTIRLYRGGGLDTQVSAVASTEVAGHQFVNPNATDEAQIGGSIEGEADACPSITGRIDDVRIYDRALGMPELNALLTEVQN